MRYKKLYDGDSIFVAKGLHVKLCCCDCGLVHKVELKNKIIDKQKGIQLTFTLDNRRTAQVRRYKK